MVYTDTRTASNSLWPRSTSLFLFLVGAVLSLLSFVVVLNMPELPWDQARDSELRATYDTYRDSGVLLLKEPGTGSVLSPGGTTMGGGPSDAGPLAAARADDPGAYIVASLMSHVTGSVSPYPGLSIAMAFLVAFPLLWLPTSVARIFRRARAGYALILLPSVMWLLNQGTILTGTEYGLADSVSTLRVPAFSGLAASLAFLSLALVLHLSTFRISRRALILASAGIALLAGLGETLKSFSGVGVAVAVGVLWWLTTTGRRRWLYGVIAATIAVALSLGVSATVAGLVETGRSAAMSDAHADSSAFHNTWQQLYLGLSLPDGVSSDASVFDVPSSERTVQAIVAGIDPMAPVGSERYDAVLRDLYTQKVGADAGETIGFYLAKTLYVIKQFGAMIAFILVAFVIALMRRSHQRRLLGASLAIAVPTLVIGLLSPVLLVPDLYHYGEFSAALGLLVAVALGALVWSLTSMPSHVRATERSRLSRRRPQHLAPTDERSHTSVIVPTRNGADVIEQTVRAIAERLREGDEIIVVENGSTDDTTAILETLHGKWSERCALLVLHSGPGLGEALRTGVLASTGQWLLLTADDLPFGFSDLDRFMELPTHSVVAVGSKAHPESDVIRSQRRMIQSRIFRFLRAALLQSKVGDSQGTIWADGEWARSFALLSRESGLMWTTELVLAAEQQGIDVGEVPVSLSDAHETGASRFRLADAWHSVVGFIRLAVYKDDYANEVWTRTPAEPESAAVDEVGTS